MEAYTITYLITSDTLDTIGLRFYKGNAVLQGHFIPYIVI